jgi:hypothetical protein
MLSRHGTLSCRSAREPPLNILAMRSSRGSPSSEVDSIGPDEFGLTTFLLSRDGTIKEILEGEAFPSK